MHPEAIGDIDFLDLPEADRLALALVRLIAASGGRCPTAQTMLWTLLGRSGPATHSGLAILAARLAAESRRRLTLGQPCCRQITWDEAALLALLSASQRHDAKAISTWIRRLGVDGASTLLQHGLAYAAAALLEGGFALAEDAAGLARPRPLQRSVSQAG